VYCLPYLPVGKGEAGFLGTQSLSEGWGVFPASQLEKEKQNS
jgi:hypothetical protein